MRLALWRWLRRRVEPASEPVTEAPDLLARLQHRIEGEIATDLLLVSLLGESARGPRSQAQRWYELAAKHARQADECGTDYIKATLSDLAKRDELIADAYAEGDEYRVLHLLDEERGRD